MAKRNWVLAALLTALSSLVASAANARFLQTDPVGYQADNNLYTYSGNDPTNKTDPLGLSGCADTKEQGLSGQCLDSQNLNKTDKKDAKNNITQKSNAFKRDGLGIPPTDRASANHAVTNPVISGNEGINRIDVSTDANGNQTTAVTPVEVTNAGPMGSQLKNTSELDGAAAAEHPHIEANGAGRGPGPQDWQIPAKTGKANYVEQGGGSVVVEISGGQVRIRVVGGPNLSRETGDYQEAQKMVNSYQEHGADP